jgi:hypothetical protein
MLYVHPDLQKRMQDRRRMEAERRALHWRLFRLSRSSRQSWVARQGCHLLCRTGRMLVRLGQQLQRAGVPQAALRNSG